MTTRKTTATSRPKLTKTDVKRSAPVGGTNQQSTGMGMLALFRDLWTTFLHKDSLDSKDGGAEWGGTFEVMRGMSFVRPVTAMEALAQAVFLYSEATDLVERSPLSQEGITELSERMARRAAGLVLWIEQAHGIDRREFGLEDFCNQKPCGRAFPRRATQEGPADSPEIGRR